MDPLEGCIADLLKQFPTHRILAVVETGERARAVEARFDGAVVKAVVPGAALYAECFDAVVSEVEPASQLWDWCMEVLPTRVAPGGAIMYRTWREAA